MNKRERFIKKMLKYKKRLKIHGLKGTEGKFYAFRSHGTPCSCSLCRDNKYKRNGSKEIIIVDD